MSAQTATLVARGARLIWKCPDCGQTLGEVFDGRVVVKIGDRVIAFPLNADVNQHCPKCFTESTARSETAA